MFMILITARRWFRVTNFKYENVYTKERAEKIAADVERHFRIKCNMTVHTSIIQTWDPPPCVL